MAIPFVLPSEDDNRSEVELEQLLGELLDINRQIQILLRARMLNRASSHTSSRVCPSQRHHHRNHHNNQHQYQTTTAVQPSILPDLVRSSLPSADGDPPSRRHHNLNASDAEASCCYHAKFTTHLLAQETDATALPLMTATAEVDVDWKQVGLIARRFADILNLKTGDRLPFMPPTSLCSSTSTSPPSCLVEDKSLLSKIIPATTSSRSLWTAVICVVGWHIFRAR